LCLVWSGPFGRWGRVRPGKVERGGPVFCGVRLCPVECWHGVARLALALHGAGLTAGRVWQSPIWNGLVWRAVIRLDRIRLVMARSGSAWCFRAGYGSVRWSAVWKCQVGFGSKGRRGCGEVWNEYGEAVTGAEMRDQVRFSVVRSFFGRFAFAGLPTYFRRHFCVG
jgi:hypothetical protein